MRTVFISSLCWAGILALSVPLGVQAETAPKLGPITKSLLTTLSARVKRIGEPYVKSRLSKRLEELKQSLHQAVSGEKGQQTLHLSNGNYSCKEPINFQGFNDELTTYLFFRDGRDQFKGTVQGPLESPFDVELGRSHLPTDANPTFHKVYTKWTPESIDDKIFMSKETTPGVEEKMLAEVLAVKNGTSLHELISNVSGLFFSKMDLNEQATEVRSLLRKLHSYHDTQSLTFQPTPDKNTSTVTGYLGGAQAYVVSGVAGPSGLIVSAESSHGARKPRRYLLRFGRKKRTDASVVVQDYYNGAVDTVTYEIVVEKQKRDGEDKLVKTDAMRFAKRPVPPHLSGNNFDFSRFQEWSEHLDPGFR